MQSPKKTLPYQDYALALYGVFAPLALSHSSNVLAGVLEAVQKQYPDWQVREGTTSAKFDKETRFVVLVDPGVEAVSAALIDLGTNEPVIGIIADPASRLFYFGIKGGGSYILAYNQQYEIVLTNKLSVKPIGGHENFVCESDSSFFMRIKRSVSSIKRTSCGVLESVRARGAILKKTTSQTAAVFIILREIGGHVTTFDGNDWSFDTSSIIAARTTEDYRYLRKIVEGS